MRKIRFGQIVLGVVLGAALSSGGMQLFGGGSSLAESLPVEAAHAGEGGADGHAAHGEAEGAHRGESGRIVLSEKAIRESGIEVAEAGGGNMEQTLTLPGEIVLNADNVAHIVPRAAGIVRRVDKYVGDDVQEGEVMAILESRELAEGKAMYLAAQQRLSLAEAKLRSAEQLHPKQIMSDLEFLARQTALAEAQIEFRNADNKLHALGVSDEQIQQLPGLADNLAIYELRAPFAGTVIEKHCSLGEVLNGEADAFVLADLSTVWVNVTVYTQDMARVHVGQTIHLRAEALDAIATATLGYVAPIANEATRSLYARADLPNHDRRWRPGTFVTASLVLNQEQVPVLIPTEAVQQIKGETVVFVADGEDFEPRLVKVGRTSGTYSEIVGGLEAGQKYVVKGAVMLKAELGKSQAAHEH